MVVHDDTPSTVLKNCLVVRPPWWIIRHEAAESSPGDDLAPGDNLVLTVIDLLNGMDLPGEFVRKAMTTEWIRRGRQPQPSGCRAAMNRPTRD